jgi:GTP-binding protein LepA
MDLSRLRNFSIIAHVDHGKSTLADRMLEITGTIESRKMKEQVLDSMELERERGITIKMQPVRMRFSHASHGAPVREYVLNLIDTPGHIDFSYEVSRALKAVEGTVLLVDATQGVQAQTLTTLNMAREQGLTIIPVVSKIDSQLARTHEVKREMINLLGCAMEDIVEVSGKTGEGVEDLLRRIIDTVPPPKVQDEVGTAVAAGSGAVTGQNTGSLFRSLVFDFQYSTHVGVIVYVRVMAGSVTKNMPLKFCVANKTFTANDVGIFMPDETPTASLSAGEIGYIVTGIKEPGIASVGDTVTHARDTAPPMVGYFNPRPVVWSSMYTESQDDFPLLKLALSRLKLTDSAFSYEEEQSGILGKGFRCGFLGMLHLEIVTERVRREANLNLVVTTPSINYDVVLKNGKRMTIFSPSFLPEEHEIAEIYEPWAKVAIIVPPEYVGAIIQLLVEHEAEVGVTETFGDSRTSITSEMPLRELMRNFFNKIKSASSGYASLSYESIGMRIADVTKIEVLVADDAVAAFARIVSTHTVERESKEIVEKLYKLLPQQMFAAKIQAKALGRIVSSRTIPALKKNVTQHMYGGDRTRKMKLWEKQKEGKKRMKERGTVDIPHDVFLKMVQSE